MKHIVTMDWLYEHLSEPQVTVVDCRFVLSDPDAGRLSYGEGHLPGAVFMDLEQDLSGPKTENGHGGRHPLPDPTELAVKLGQAGINGETQVIVYDDQGGAMASRLWWLLQYYGHEQVFVLDGGFSSWVGEGYPVTKEIPKPKPVLFQLNIQEDMLVNVDAVRAFTTGEREALLLDSREKPRYEGISEPIDAAAGHIPGALNYFWKDSITAEGRWKGTKELQKRFIDLNPKKEVIVYCGSGVTACPNVIALKEAGFINVKLYAGSWSDWISYAGNPIATGEE